MDTLSQKIYFLIIKINNFWGDFSGISAKTATLHGWLVSTTLGSDSHGQLESTRPAQQWVKCQNE